MKQTLEEGYNKFVIKNPEGCWGWTGCAPKNPGYGQFRATMKLIRSHRASWMIHFGDIPKGLSVLHKCDNRICSNPDHLFLGTTKDNLLDMISKKRHPTLGRSGENNHMSVLKLDQVIEIKRLLANGVKSIEIANKFNVLPARICDIKHGRTWSRLPFHK